MRQVVPLILTFACVSASPAPASPLYSLTGTLAWVSATGADRLSANGLAFEMTFDVLGGTPVNRADPNGTQSQYGGSATLRIGEVPVGPMSAIASFFHSSGGMGDVANFVLVPLSGSPSFYYPAVQLPFGANATASVRPPVFPAGTGISAFLLIPGPDPGLPADNAVYQIQGFSFSSAAVPEPAPGLLALTLGLAAGVRRMFR